jgi:hypothetical protein
MSVGVVIAIVCNLGVVSQGGRHQCTISDYTYLWVHEEMVAIAPGECMPFGHTLWRILKHVKHANPKMGPICLSKIEITDRFYHIWVRASDVPNMGILFLSRAGGEPSVGFPLTLPMGWKESPKIITASTETVTHFANQKINNGPIQTPHQLEVEPEQITSAPEVPLYTL